MRFASANTVRCAALCVVVFGCLGSARAEESYKQGDRMVEIVLEDQHGASGTVDGDTARLLFARDMDAGDVVKAALAEDGAALLDSGGTVYVADISGMPGLVRRLFALPKMRKRGYSMLLDVEGEVTQRIPTKAGSATLIDLDALEITNLFYISDVEELKAALRASD